MHQTRKEATKTCRLESTAAKHYSKLANNHAEQGEYSKAWKMADTAMVAAKCAMQAHQELWKLSGGKLTSKEFEAFEAAEIAQAEARKATKAAADTAAKLNA